MATTGVLVLGPVRVQAGDTVTSPPSAVARKLLGLLALARTGITDSVLTAAIWGENASKSALSVAVTRLRTWLRDRAGDEIRINRTSTGYVLVGEVDARRFVEQASPEVLSLWQGDPLADVDGLDIVRDAIDELWRVHRSVVLAHGKNLLAVGRAEQAVAAVLPWTQRDPLDEQVHAVLIEALAVDGRQAEALNRYEEIRVRLADDLGVDPGQDLAGALVRVLRQEWSVPTGQPAVVPAQLPPDNAGFTGRERQLAELDRLLAKAGSVVISAVAGIGGVGKTTLAVHWAHRVAERFPDGQLHVDLRGYSHADPVTPVEALSQFIRALGGQPPVDLDEATALYRTLLAGKRVLVLLDNAVDVAQVRPLLPGSPGCLVLVTTRDRLDGLVAREGAYRLALDVLTPDESVALLTEVLGADRVAHEPEAVAKLAALCGHLPLALRIVAANLVTDPSMSVAEQVAALRADRLEELTVVGDPGSSVRAAFDLSFRRLAPADQRLFVLLGVAPGTDITAPAAAVLSGQSEPDTKRALARLVAAHLLLRHGDRYSFHDLVGDYAREHAGDDAEPTELCRWYLAMAYGALKRWRRMVATVPMDVEPADFPDAETASAWLIAEMSNLAAVVEHTSVHGPYELAWQLADMLRQPLRDSDRTDLWKTVVEAVDSAATAADDVFGRAVAARSVAVYHYFMGLPEPVAKFERAVAASRSAGWVEGEVAMLNGLAAATAMTGRLAEAIELFQAVVELSERQGDIGVKLFALGNIGTTYAAMGELARSEHSRKQALAGHRALGQHYMEANDMENLGYLYVLMGRPAEAREVLEAGLALAREHVRRVTEASILENIARVECVTGDRERGYALAEQSLAIAEKVDQPRQHARSLVTLGEIARLMGDHDQAVSWCRRAAEVTQRGGDTVTEAEAMAELAMAYCAQSTWPHAMRYAQSALVLAGQAHARLVEADALTALATAYLGQQRADLALTHATRALTIMHTSGARPAESRIHRLLGDIHATQGRTPEAAEHWQAALELFTSIGMPEADQVRLQLAAQARTASTPPA